jgi:hypothetical protein
VGYCSAPPTVESWPNCPAFKAEDNKVSVGYRDWQALQVNGRRPGETVKAYGVNATIPKPWEYGIKSDVGTFSYVRVDGHRYGPDVGGAPVQSSVHLHMVGMPKRVGLCVFERSLCAVVRDQTSTVFGTSYELLQAAFMLRVKLGQPYDDVRKSDGSRYVVRLYLAIVAVQTGDTLHEVPTFVETSSSVVRLPLGSVISLHLTVRWRTEYADYAAYPFGGPYLRVIRDPAFYEEIAKKGKLNGPFPAGARRRYRLSGR